MIPLGATSTDPNGSELRPQTKDRWVVAPIELRPSTQMVLSSDPAKGAVDQTTSDGLAARPPFLTSQIATLSADQGSSPGICVMALAWRWT